MPVIREYQQQTRAPGPVNQPAYSADQFGAAEGRAMEQAGAQVLDAAQTVAKRLDQERTSDVTAKLSQANADLAIELQETIRKADPGDKTVFENYNKKVEETLGKIGEEATTQSSRQFYAEASTRIKGQLASTAASGQAELAGIKAVNDYTSTLNNLSAATVADPSSVELQRGFHRQAIENLVATGQLPRSKAIELQAHGDSSLAKASIRGWIQINPDHAAKKLKEGIFDQQLGAEGKLQLLGEVDQAKRAAEIDAERRRQQQERIVKERQKSTQNDFLEAMVNGSLDSKTILNSNLDPFGSGSKEQFLQMMKAHNEREIKTDPQVMISLFQRIHLPDGDPNKLVDENDLNQSVINGHLSFTDLNRLREEMQGKNTQSGQIEHDMKKQVLEIARSKLTKSNPMLGIKDPAGDEQMAKFMAYFFDEYKTQRAAGVPATDLLNPNSPKYLGHSLANYTRTHQQIMRDMVPRRTPPTQNGLSSLTPQVQGAQAAPTYTAPPKPKPLPRQPNETAKQYLDRIKSGGG